MGVAVIPGVLIICTFVMMLTNGPSEAGTYTGAAYEGIALLPALGDKLDFILKPLFGLQALRAFRFRLPLWVQLALQSVWFQNWFVTAWQPEMTLQYSPQCVCAGVVI